MTKNSEIGIKIGLLITLLLISPIFATPTLEMSPGIFDINLYGGESVQKNITILATGFETSIIVDLDYEINSNYNDTEGFNINFSESYFILEINQPKLIIMSISTVPNLKPDCFEIKILAKTEIQQDTKTVYKTTRQTKTIYLENKTNQTVYINKTEYIPIYINQTKEIPVDRLINHSTFYEDTEMINELKSELKNSKDHSNFLKTCLALFGLLVIIFITIIYLLKNNLIKNPFT